MTRNVISERFGRQLCLPAVLEMRRVLRTAGILELEGVLYPGSVRPYPPVFEFHVEFDDLGDAEIPEGLCSPLDGSGCGLLPRLSAGADDLGEGVPVVGHYEPPITHL